MTEQSGSSVVPGWVRGWTVALGAGAGAQGVWGFFWPRAFYDDFPAPGLAWVSTLGPYDEHLVRDVGALLLGFAVLTLLAARSRSVDAIRVAMAGLLVFGSGHLGFHLFRLGEFEAGSAAAQVASLATLIVIPVALLVGLARAREA